MGRSQDLADDSKYAAWLHCNNIILPMYLKFSERRNSIKYVVVDSAE